MDIIMEFIHLISLFFGSIVLLITIGSLLVLLKEWMTHEVLHSNIRDLDIRVQALENKKRNKKVKNSQAANYSGITPGVISVPARGAKS